jgi:hypothetical protein
MGDSSLDHADHGWSLVSDQSAQLSAGHPEFFPPLLDEFPYDANFLSLTLL